ncbi:cell wall-associated NlpC family hydrolase [Kribbella aluminosa]|uniref:Cell wall-associated NlpC family hydrolase n=1 Tax=Kribbella aluminosa TaxID=416017 RepID=A0ABS4UJ82_9ACTN|nr:CHAP domain-containing protein [Kribbella aluminosa]MBP2351711.1 cell wall-associated NlpC family hydrolase [Kribbella aluminosa]
MYADVQVLVGVRAGVTVIVKAAIASAALIGSIGLIAPIALATGGGAACSTPSDAPPTESTPTDVGPIGADRTVATAIGARSTAVRLTEVRVGAAPDGCKAPVSTGGQLPGADQAVARAMSLVGSHGYYQLCARLAANIWGRQQAGYFSAAEQWRQMVATGNAHPNDRRPPTGALVFWATGGPYGHVAVYLGNGRIISNDIGDDISGEGGVYLVDFGLIESKWGATYLGWAPPIYSTT